MNAVDKHMNKTLAPTRWPHVAVGIPCGERVHTGFALSLWAIGRMYPGRMGTITGQSSKGPASQRNMCVQSAQNYGKTGADKFDFILFCDTDMTLPADTVQRLVAHDKDIVCATYVRRGEPFDTMGIPLGGGRAKIDTGLLEMEKVPAGLLMVRMSVFTKLKMPYFFCPPVPDTDGGVGGEDYYFSECCMAAGFHLFCDIDLSKEIGHMFEYKLMPKDEATQSVSEAIAERQRRVG